MQDTRRHLSFSFRQVVSTLVVVRKAVAQGMFFMVASKNPIAL
jgi:hypothetical protein